MSESQKKSSRTFQCRDALWDKFEEMAQDLECSVDYLINDAMKQYARQRGVSPVTAAPPSSASAAPGPMSARAAASPKPAPLPAVSVAAPVPAPAPPPTGGGLPPLPSRGPARSPLPSMPGHAGLAAPPPPLPVPQGLPGPATVPISPSRMPPPPPAGLSGGPKPPAPPPPRGKPGAAGPTLTVYYEGAGYPVHKDGFIIGRGKQVSDLTIRDPNISRQHAVIEFSGGAFWMVDLESTNGVEFNGQRVGRKQIQNGEVYRICSHELLMSLS